VSVKGRLAALVNRGLRAFGGELVSGFEIARLRAAWQRRPRESCQPLVPPGLPEGASEYLRQDNPRLIELRKRYAAVLHDGAARSAWSPDHVASGVDLRQFRGDSAFVWQSRTDGLREVNYALATLHCRGIDRLKLLDALGEDGLFGAVSFEIDGKRVTRDLLDVVCELNFLDEALGIAGRRGAVLDVGAGYGRLAYGFARAFPRAVRTLCADAIPEATFLSEYYLRFRRVEDVASVVPLDEIEAVLARTPVFLATNIHSFSEIPLRSIRWWLALLARHRIRHLMIVPNSDEDAGMSLRSLEADGTRLDAGRVLEDHGYSLVVRRPKYTAPSVQRHGLSPTHYLLYELS
jgi:hypothetical protein